MLRNATPFEQFSSAESRLLQLLGRDERLFELSTWEAADRQLLGLFPAISSALSVLSGEEAAATAADEPPRTRRGSASPRESPRASPCSSLGGGGGGGCGGPAFGASSSLSFSSGSSSRGSARGSPPSSAVPRPPARWCRPGFKDLQQLVSSEDVASIPRASSIEEVLALLSKDDVIVVPTHGGAILYEVTYLDDLVTQQPPTVVPPSPDDPATQLSPEVFDFFLRNEELLAQCQESAALFTGEDLRFGLFC